MANNPYGGSTGETSDSEKVKQWLRYNRNRQPSRGISLPEKTLSFNPKAKLDASQVRDRRGRQVTRSPQGQTTNLQPNGWPKPSADNAALGKKWNQPSNGANNVGSSARSDAFKRALSKYK